MLQENRQSIDHNGEKVFFSVSPCSWMKRGYGLQISISMAEYGVNAESEFVVDKSYEASDKPHEQLDAAGKVLAQKWLDENGTQPLHALAAKWHGTKEQFAVDIVAIEKREAAAQKRADKRHKTKGYTHRVNAVIHPEHGDDRITVSYIVGAPTDEDIAAILRASVVKDDYVVTEL